MDRYLRPERFDSDPNSGTDVSSLWIHWKQTFENFIKATSHAVRAADGAATPFTDEAKYQLLINHVSSTIFRHILDCQSYETAIRKLDAIFIKPTNEIYARYCLAKRHQEVGESIDQYLQNLKLMSKECKFRKVSALENENDFIRDSFIAGLSSANIRQRLLENLTLSLDDAYNQARALELAQIQSDKFRNNDSFINEEEEEDSMDNEDNIVRPELIDNYEASGSEPRAEEIPEPQPSTSDCVEIRRSNRNRKPPVYLKDYIRN